MPSARHPSGTRALRVGVVLSETMIAEHVVRSGTAFTIGQSIRNLVPLPVPGLPRRWQLLELVEHGVLLRLGPGMGARVAVGGTVLGRADLDQRGAATRAATLVTVPPGSHGKLQLGEVTILFQELALPRPAPAPALPRALKGSLAERIDRRMAAFAAASLLVHFGIMTAASLHDGPADASPAERALAQYTPETISVIDADDPVLDLEPATTPATPAPPVTPPRAGAATPARPAPTRASRPAAAQPAVADPSRLRADADRFATELFSSDRGGMVATDLDRRAPGTDLGKQLGEIADDNANVTIGKPASDRPGDGTPRIGTTAKPLGPDGPDLDRVDDDKREHGPKPPKIKIPQPPKQPGIDTAPVVEKIRTAYVAGLRRCYTRALGPQPGLAGKVTLSFTLTEKGKTEDGHARGVEDGLEDCIEGLMTRWSFAPITDKSGEALEVDIAITLQLAI